MSAPKHTPGPLNARLLAAAYTSYDRHCGPRAVECAEADLLGEALGAALNAAEDLKTVLVDDDELPGHVRKALRSAHDALEAVLAKVKP